MEFESEQLQDFDRQSDLKCGLPPFKFGEKANTDPGHAGRIFQCQPSIFATLAHNLADLSSVVDFGHCTLIILPLGKNNARFALMIQKVVPIGKSTLDSWTVK